MSKKLPTRRAKSGQTTSPIRGKAGSTATAKGVSSKAEIDAAITTDLAPAVALALLAKTESDPNAPAPALEALAAGASPSEDDAKVRLQVVFDNGSVLPIEMSKEAGSALNQGLTDTLGKGAARPA